MNGPRDTAPSETSGGLWAVSSWDSDRLVLVLHGDLDIDTLPTAQDEVSAAEGQAPRVLVLDLSQLGYVDSSGVRMVLLAQQVADDAGRLLAVRLGHGATRRVFDMLGITGRLEVLDEGEASP
ncbi:STAS domain-containing protein [Actinomycetospora endophytica]|uniref:STAS domain-containing protein n=1 Tax=Actinomycetospora endophytica TaxID=2291215 RepID=A0ABS8PIR2_9PSEU|nr:STAS domain-containing protein [Actinomycetospora endophytica]MCD2198145.1 STAS domain-containing protein [Actinomycetospora endophytica]